MAEQGTSYLNAESSMPPKQRMVITLNAHGLPVGENSTKLSSRCGQLVRTIVPISYKDWHAVPNEKKDELWKLLLERVQDLLCSQEVDSQDIQNDPLTKVFGMDKRGRVRGVGNIVSRSQIISSSPALEKLAMKDKEVTEQSSMVKNLESQVDYIRVEQKGLMEEFKGLKQLIEHSMTSGSQASATLPHKNKESVVVSNTIGNDQSPLTLRPCKLMSWRQEVVALGRAYIENGPQQIHSKSLPAGYYKVSIDVIEKADVELPYPDGFHSTLGEVGNGSFVAWLEVFSIFTD